VKATRLARECPAQDNTALLKGELVKGLEIKLLRKFILASACCLVLSCASIPGETPSPWDFPKRGYQLTSDREQANLLASMLPCIDYARETFPEVLRRYESGFPEGTDFKVIVFDDEQYTSQVSVWFIEDELIEGRIKNLHTIKGKPYIPGDIIYVNRADLVDWYVVYRDRPAEGNLIGKYLLLKQDGLAAGACDPHDLEFQRYRFFGENYSFVPPGPDGWEMRVPAEGHDVLMLEKGAGPDEINTLSSARYRFPMIATHQELVSATRGFMQYSPEDSDRYTLVEHEIEPFSKKEMTPVTFNNLAICVISRQTIADRQALLAESGKRGTLIRESRTLVCIHPGESDMAVVVNYSHRYLPGRRDPEFTSKADQVFQSIAFKTRN